MKLEDFLRELTKIKESYYWFCWVGNGTNEIKGVLLNQVGYMPNYCPITAVASNILQKSYLSKSCYHAALDLGMDFHLINDLITACNTYDCQILRNKIESIIFKRE